MNKPTVVSSVIVFGAVAASVVPAGAATPQSACTAYMTASDANYNDSSFNHGAHWSDGKIPGLGSTNYVGEAYGISDSRQDSADIPYPGDVLVLAGTFSSWARGKSIVWPELRLQDGAKYSFSSAGHVGGTVVVESGMENPARFSMYYSESTVINCYLYARFLGDAGTELLLTRTGERPTKPKAMAYCAKGDWSAYFGRLRVGSDTELDISGGQTVFGGTICRDNGSIFELRTDLSSLGGLDLAPGVTQVIPAAEDALTVGTLTLADSSALEVPVSASGATRPIIVTNRLTSGLANLRLKVASGYVFGATPPKFEVFRLSAEAVAAGSDYSRMYVTISASGAPTGAAFARLVAETDAAGGQTVFVTYPTADFTMNVANGTGADSAFGPDNGRFWLDGVIPTEASSGTVLCTESLSVLEDKEYAFPNLTFELAAGKTFYNHGKTFSCQNMVLWPGANVNVYRNADTVLAGRTTIMPGEKPVAFEAWETRMLSLQGTLCGSGDIQFLQSTSARPGKFNVNVDATAFSGNLQVGGSGKTGSGYAYFGGACFGGPYAGSSAWRSITFTNSLTIAFLSDIAMSEPTRGVFIASDTTFDSQGGKSRTLTITEPVTYNGVLKKNFAGDFVLGGTARFVDGNPETEPVEGKNRLQVVGGTLKVVSAQALNGVQLEMSDGVRLILDPTPDEPGLATTGIVNTRWGTPFVSGAADGRIKVKIGSDPVFSTAYDAFRVAICTVTAAAAASLEFDLDATAVTRGVAELGRTTNADGTVTVYVEFCRRGLAIVIR